MNRMKKRKMHITLRTNDVNEEYNLLGEYDEEHKILTYQEKKNLVTIVKIDFLKKYLSRENKDYSLHYQFQENKVTSNPFHLKELNQNLMIKIKTEKFLVTENKIEIQYTLLDSNEKVNYQVEF